MSHLSSSSSCRPRGSSPSRVSAVVYCEGNFGKPDGKTANGLVRSSERYEIVAVIDSEQVGRDAGFVLDGTANGIPLCADLDGAIDAAGGVPNSLIFGVAPTSGMLSPSERSVMLDAMRHGMNLVNGLHEFLTEDDEFAATAAQHGVSILVVRKPHDKKDLHMFSGRIASVDCPRIAVLGTAVSWGQRSLAPQRVPSKGGAEHRTPKALRARTLRVFEGVCLGDLTVSGGNQTWSV